MKKQREKETLRKENGESFAYCGWTDCYLSSVDSMSPKNRDYVLCISGAWQNTRRSNQSILKEISPEYSLEGLMLKLQYFGHLMQRVN